MAYKIVLFLSVEQQLNCPLGIGLALVVIETIVH